MADSNITCSGLIATSGVGQVALQWALALPPEAALPYLALDAVEVWAATANDRALAAKVGEGATSAIHAGVPEEESRWYWLRARTVRGQLGEWFPLSSTGGVQGISATATIMRAGLVVGGLIKTAETGNRVELRGVENALVVYDSNTDRDWVRIGNPSPDSRELIFADALSPNAVDQVSRFRTFWGDCSRAEVFLQKPGATRGGGAAFVGSAPIYAFYAQAGGYGPFTGAHEGLWPIEVPLPEPGDIVADRRIMFRSGLSNTLAEMEPAFVFGPPAIGVFTSACDVGRTAAIPDEVSDDEIDALARTHCMIAVNAVGEGQINVCDAGGPISPGDLLTAGPIAGKAMRQADDLMRASTVARAREAASFTASGRAQIACIYLAG